MSDSAGCPAFAISNLHGLFGTTPKEHETAFERQQFLTFTLRFHDWCSLSLEELEEVFALVESYKEGENHGTG